MVFETDLNTAFEKARLRNKPVFIEFYNSECPVCRSLEPVFSDPELSRFYNENFICYKLNTEKIKKTDSLFLADQKLEFDGFPYFTFFDANRQFLHYAGTKKDIALLISIGKTALNPEERASNLQNKYNAGDRSIKTLYAYSNLLRQYKNDSMRAVVADDLFAVFPKEQLGSEKSYIITRNCVSSMENGFFKYWIDHVEEANAIEKKEKNLHPTNVLGDILQKNINGKERKNWDLQKIGEVKKMILKTEMSKDPDAFFWEQESTLLEKDNRDPEILEIFRNRIVADSGKILPSVYTINFFLNLLHVPKSLVSIKIHIDRLSRMPATPEEKGSLLYADILYFKKIDDKKTAMRLGKDALGYYQLNHLDPSRLKQLLPDLQ
jgi:thiol-disulfide isomerase/thioredoxin